MNPLKRMKIELSIREKLNCIHCKHFRSITIGEPIGPSVRFVEMYCILGNINPKQKPCKDFKYYLEEQEAKT
jgi:hypothetical protein